MPYRKPQWLDAFSQRIAWALGRHAGPAVRGIILLFHEVHEHDDRYVRELKSGSTVAFLDAIVSRLRRDGWDIIPLDEVPSRLERDDTDRRFAVLTFDDGYRDNLKFALPVLERHAAPFTVFVPTGAITRELDAWWLGVRALIQRNEFVEIKPMNATIDCCDIAAKIDANATVKTWVHQDYRRLHLLADTFRAYDISLSSVNDSYFMDDSELKAMARHPLATIGAHTQSHPALALLASGEARREIADNRRYLETLLDRPIHHFAYPFGSPSSFGEREVGLVAEIGFQTAVTTEKRCLSKDDRRASYRLPRMELIGATTHLDYCFRILHALDDRTGRGAR